MTEEKVFGIEHLDLTKAYHAFHKGIPKGNKGWFFSSFIKRFRNISVSHVETWFPKRIAGESNSFSSRGTGSKKGVGFKKIDYSHPERWVFVPTRIKDKRLRNMYNHAKTHCGQKYGYGDLLLVFLFKFKKVHNKFKYFCSEICSHIWGYEPERQDPGDMLKQALRKSHGIYYEFDEAGNMFKKQSRYF